MAKVTRMWVKSIKSIGFVDRGACHEADILIAKRNAADTAGSTDSLIPFVVEKVDDDQRRVYAWAYVTHKADGSLAFDSGGETRDGAGNVVAGTERDVVDTPEALKAFTDAFYEFVSSGKAGSDDMHVDFDVARVVGGLVFEPDVTKALKIPDGVVPTGAVVVIDVPTTERGNQLWQAIKSGERKQLSMVARIQREVIDATEINPALAAKAGRKMSRTRMAAMQDAITKLMSIWDEVKDPEDHEEEDHMADAKKLEELTAKVDALTAENTALKADIAKRDAKPPTEEDVLKNADPAVRTLLETLKKQNDETAAKLEAETEARKKAEDERLTAVYVEKAKKLAAPGASADELGGILKRAAAVLSTEDCAKLEQVLSTAGEVARKSTLFKSIGADGGDASNAIETLNRLATEAVTKGEAKTHEKAMEIVAKRNPELYAQYRAEQRQRS